MTTELWITIAASLIGTIITFWVGFISTQQIRRHSKNMTKSFDRTRDLISKITGLFAASEMVGIETAYENREVALLERNADGKDAQSFLQFMKTEPKLIVVGSSLLGLRMYITKLSQYLRWRKGREGYETKLLLTHPCFSALREDQEKRSQGQIRKEIQDTLRYLEKDCALDLNMSIRFYKGTPTCFMIVTSNAMLLNPYPYQTEAYRAFCLEVRRLERDETRVVDSDAKSTDIIRIVDSERFEKDVIEAMKSPDWARYDYSGDVGPDIYGQFYWYHYFLPWFSRQAVTYEEYINVCEKHKCIDSGFTSECPLTKKRIEKTDVRTPHNNSHDRKDIRTDNVTPTVTKTIITDGDGK